MRSKNCTIAVVVSIVLAVSFLLVTVEFTKASLREELAVALLAVERKDAYSSKEIRAALNESERRWEKRHATLIDDSVDELRRSLAASNHTSAASLEELRSIIKRLQQEVSEKSEHNATALSATQSELIAWRRAVEERLELLEKLGEVISRQVRNESLDGVASSVRGCSLSCSHRGLSARIRNVTVGCECICVEGWSGLTCQNNDKGQQSADAMIARGIRLVEVPMERDDKHVDSADVKKQKLCKEASVDYFMQRKGSDEFRTDKGLDFFWKLALESLPPYCSTEKVRSMVVDVGAHVGDDRKLAMWEELLLGDNAAKHRCDVPPNGQHNDSVVLLVEPNPINMLLMKSRLRQSLRPQLSENVFSSKFGHFVLSNKVAAHYDGDVEFEVDETQNRNNRLKGNERGHVIFNREGAIASSSPHRRVIQTYATTMNTLVKDVSALTTSHRRITNISLLKIDAEGADPLVLYGASEILPFTNAVVFECHKLWALRAAEYRAAQQKEKLEGVGASTSGWTLHDVSEYLSKFGFDVYKIGVFYWIPVTPPHYWDDRYDEHMEWSNCVAVRKGHPLRRVFSVPPPCD